MMTFHNFKVHSEKPLIESYKEKHKAVEEPGAALSCSFFNLETRMCSMYSFRPSECRFYYCDDWRLSLDRMALSVAAYDDEIAVAQMVV